MMNLVFSKKNKRNDFEDLPENSIPLVEMTDEDLAEIAETATSATIFFDSDSRTPEAIQNLTVLKQSLEWKGDIPDVATPWESETRSGKIQTGFLVNVQRELSRRLDASAFITRLAGLSR